MTKELADALCAAADANGVEYDRRDDYSGRGMFGRTTVGIVIGDMGTLAFLVAEAARYLPSVNVAEKVRGVRTDSMGQDLIVY